MSSFKCEKCGENIIDTDKGYITFCEHYPKEKITKPSEIFMDDEALWYM